MSAQHSHQYREEQRDAGLVELFLKMPSDLRKWWQEYVKSDFVIFETLPTLIPLLYI